MNPALKFGWSALEWRHWRWWYAIAGTLLSVVSALAPTALSLSDGVGQALQALLQIALVIALAALLSGRISAADVGLQWRGTRRTVAVALLTAVVMWVASWLFARYSRDGAEASRQVMASFAFGENTWRDAGLVLMIGMLGPLTEEVLFRGLIFRSLRDGSARWRWMPGWLASALAMLVSAWLFMGIHGGEGQDAQLWMLMLMGVFFALSYEFGGTLFAPILAHSLNNSYALFNGLTGNDATFHAPPWMLALILACPLIALALARAIGWVIPDWISARHRSGRTS